MIAACATTVLLALARKAVFASAVPLTPASHRWVSLFPSLFLPWPLPASLKVNYTPISPFRIYPVGSHIP
ncbi:hypothetical protein E2C01_005216 [Portunus trituberculatus]|uniref:Secreted protein n=1 Tax=Portunus trituberculatus TaxID=210409 RepID=A0A5B7CTP0_PORTR|nr:hypothetical protein [Portunus trituberculatus]